MRDLLKCILKAIALRLSNAKILAIIEVESKRMISSRRFKAMLAIMMLPDILYLLGSGNVSPALGGTKVCFEEFWRQAGELIINFWTGLPAQLLAILVASELIAGEFNEGTFKLLMTKPISKSSVVMGKWIAFVICMIIVSLPSLLFLALIVSIVYKGWWDALVSLVSYDVLVGEAAVLLGLITFGSFTMLFSSLFSRPLYAALSAFTLMALYQFIVPNLSWLENPARYTLSYQLGLFLEECGFVLSPGGRLYEGDLQVMLLTIYSVNCLLMATSMMAVYHREVK
ncbi:MAG: ABC transporter permease subunit [Thermoprotei archaeon]|nr:ABC transporter permease subunit [Thermoprotei archaeon]